jgi:large-conductance mechanosensitive channel
MLSAIKHQSEKRNSIMISVLVAALMADTMISNISDIISPQLISVFGVALFIALGLLIFGPGQYLLLDYVQKVSRDLRKNKPNLNLIHKAVTITQYVLMAILSIMFIQIILTSQYYVVLLVAATAISYTFSGIIMGLLSYRFFSWYKIYRRNIMILMYAIAAAMTALAAVNLGVSQNGLLLETNIVSVGPQTQINFPKIVPDPTGILGDLYSISLIQTMLAYGLTWVASAILLHHYSHRLGLRKYLIITIVPGASFLFGITPILVTLPSTGTYFDPGLLIFRILSISALIAVGVLFGAAFLTVARSVRQHIHDVLVDYLKIAAYGAALLFISLAANIAHGAYPPFGVATYSFTAMASYFFMVGIYSSAISVSMNSKVRQYIRKSAIEESKLLDSIGSAYMTEEIEKRVMLMTKQNSDKMAMAGGIEPTLSKDEAKEYLAQVLEEIQRDKDNKKRNRSDDNYGS